MSQPSVLSVIGAYGPWAASLLPADPGPLSLQNCPPAEFVARQLAARARTLTCMASPPQPGGIKATVQRSLVHDGLAVEEISWQLPYGPPTQAVVLKPAGATGRLPAVLALHDHGRFKFLGKEKIAQTGPRMHPLVALHQADAYEGLAWANELAHHGYVVLVHDAFAFGSRKVRIADVPAELRGTMKDDSDDSPAGIAAYNDWAADHEHVMAKSLFSAGTTWPGVFAVEDRVALDVLCARADVDASRVGCGGLSGGGLRTVFLAGLDERIKAAVCVGMMTTWRDYVLSKSFTHTWMCYVPLLPRDIDYPEILGLRAPRPTLVLNTRADPFFSVSEMERADGQIANIYATSGSPSNYRCSWYPGHHQFNRAMQTEAFGWFDQWLG
ncbi:MAG: hypothetical protein ABI222_14430 [Opitutaceae bacterium]